MIATRDGRARFTLASRDVAPPASLEQASELRARGEFAAARTLLHAEYAHLPAAVRNP